MERVNVIFLHGFLGRPADWSLIKDMLPSGSIHTYTPDYTSEPELGPQHSFEAWGENFVRWTERVVGSHHRNILVGYSLGGRLALHALEKNPHLYDKVILLSTNPGFEDEFHDRIELSEERKKRWLSDSYWAEEFSKTNWETVLRNWNAQPVFGGGTTEPIRKETDYSRETLGLVLTQWSLAQQRNMRDVLIKNLSKVHLLVGESDEKFLSLTLQLKRRVPDLKVDMIPHAGHRIPFDSPERLAEKILKLLQQ